jgi:hypothetical protein
MKDVKEQIRELFNTAVKILNQKKEMYGSSVTGLKPTAFADLLFIKINKAMSELEEDNGETEIFSVINYSLLFLQKYAGLTTPVLIDNCCKLIEERNQSYRQAYQKIFLDSILAFIEMKILRLRSLSLAFDVVKEQCIAELYDIVNYCVLYLVRIKY